MALCLRLPTQLMAVNIFLGISTVVVAATGFFLYQHPRGGVPARPEEALLVGAGWLVVGLGYLAIIASTRIAILLVMSRLRPRLDVGNSQMADAY